MSTVVFDIEADLIPSTKIYCNGIAVDDEETQVYSMHPISGATAHLTRGETIMHQADVLVGHNIISYDLPTLKRLRDFHVSSSTTVRDTIIILKLNGFRPSK